jgi:hypothetical protein
MIVNYTSSGWEIITQRAHGLLAAQIAMQWRKNDRPERWTETLIAIAEHDDAQIEMEANDLLTPQGGPMNFAMKKFDEEHCCRLQDFAISKSRYTALLCSMHVSFLHKNEAKTNANARKYLDKQADQQKTWRKELSITQKQANTAYGLLEWCDALSLLLCQNEIQPEHRLIEVSQGPDKTQYMLIQKLNDALTIKPWPFEDEKFELTIEYRIIPQLTFKDNEAFKTEFLKATVQEKMWRLEK